jgi:hypothetical protein
MDLFIYSPLEQFSIDYLREVTEKLEAKKRS